MSVSVSSSAPPESIPRQTHLVQPPQQSMGQGTAVSLSVSFVPEDTGDVVHGVPLGDNGMSKLMRRVILLATCGASFYMSMFIFNLLTGNYDSERRSNVTTLWAALSTLFIELSIPACGYSGALYNNRQLTCCFCSCNLSIAVISIMSFIQFHIRIAEINGDCTKEMNPGQRSSCETWVAGGMDKYMMIVSRLFLINMTCLAFWFGNSLYNRLAHDFASFVPVPPLPLVGEVIPSAGAESGGEEGTGPISRAVVPASPQGDTHNNSVLLGRAAATAPTLGAVSGTPPVPGAVPAPQPPAEPRPQPASQEVSPAAPAPRLHQSQTLQRPQQLQGDIA